MHRSISALQTLSLITLIAVGATASCNRAPSQHEDDPGPLLFAFPDSLGTTWNYSYSKTWESRSGALYSHRELSTIFGTHQWTVVSVENAGSDLRLRLSIDKSDSVRLMIYDPVDPPSDFTPILKTDTSYTQRSQTLCPVRISPDSVVCSFGESGYILDHFGSEFPAFSRRVSATHDSVALISPTLQVTFVDGRGLCRFWFSAWGMTGGGTEVLGLDGAE